MRTNPGQLTLGAELTQKQFWLAAYLASLHRAPPAQARAEADLALKECNERWGKPEYIGTLIARTDYPVGYPFDWGIGESETSESKDKKIKKRK